MPRVYSPQFELLDIGAEDAVSKGVFAENYDTLIVSVVVDGDFDGTLFVLGSQEGRPNYAIPSSNTNRYTTLASFDNNNRVNYDGSLGIVFGTDAGNGELPDGTYSFQVNIDAIDDLSLKVEGATQGTFKASIKMYA